MERLGTVNLYLQEGQHCQTAILTLQRIMSHGIFSLRLKEFLLEERSNRCQQVNHHLSTGNWCFWKQAVLATAFDRLCNEVLQFWAHCRAQRHLPLQISSFLNKYMEGKSTKWLTSQVRINYTWYKDADNLCDWRYFFIWWVKKCSRDRSW